MILFLCSPSPPCGLLTTTLKRQTFSAFALKQTPPAVLTRIYLGATSQLLKQAQFAFNSIGRVFERISFALATAAEAADVETGATQELWNVKNVRHLRMLVAHCVPSGAHVQPE